jgi:hypothetical protein
VNGGFAFGIVEELGEFLVDLDHRQEPGEAGAEAPDKSMFLVTHPFHRFLQIESPENCDDDHPIEDPEGVGADTETGAALTNAGDREAANEIRYLGRVRERETEKGLAFVLSGAVQYVAGFGIGTYTFRVLYWVIGISLAGAALLWMKVPAAKQHGPIWCFGASLARLLPVIEINKEFTAFFDDPKRERLSGWQSFIFSAIGIVGFVLGAILIAAVSGLTQSS